MFINGLNRALALLRTVLVGALALACTLAAHGQGEQELKQAALQAYHANLHDEAVQHFLAYLQLRPTDTTALRQLGNSYSLLGQHEQALATHSQAIAVEPDNSQNWNARCWTQLMASQVPQARPDCEQALRLAPANWAARLNLGHAWLLAGQAEQAQAHYREVLWQLPSEEALQDGPHADFELFAERGWQQPASQQAQAWFAQAWPRWREGVVWAQEAEQQWRSGQPQAAAHSAKAAVERAAELLGDTHPQTMARAKRMVAASKASR